MRNPTYLVIDWLERKRRFAALAEVRGKLLDIGCKHNLLVESYRQRGGEGTGVDVFDFGGADLIVEDTTRLPFADQAFDTITFVASLNHIPNRADVLREACRLLKNDGQVVATMIPPGISRLWHGMLGSLEDDQTLRGMKPGEVWGITPREIRELFASVGFETVKHRRFVLGLNHLYVARKATPSSPKG